MVVLKGVTVKEPAVGWLPDHPPDAVQEVALVVDQLSITEFPELIVAGFAVRVITGAATV